MTFAFELFDLYMMLATKQEEEKGANAAQKGIEPALSRSESQEQGNKNSQSPLQKVGSFEKATEESVTRLRELAVNCS